MLSTSKSRRRFLTTLAGTAAAVGLPLRKLGAAQASEMASPVDWMSGVKGDNRCFFDFNQHKAGVPLFHMLNYLNTYKEALGAQPGQVGAVGSFYGIGPSSSIALAFNDAMWAKYQLGEYTGLKDASGKPYTRNVFASATPDDRHLLIGAMNVPDLPQLGGALPAISIPNLQQMGSTFLLCNNAFGAWQLELAARGKGTVEAIGQELRANLLPGVIIVPAMVIAIEQAQKAGIAYNRQ